MKKLIISLVALVMATMLYAQNAENISSQAIETPVSYAYLPGQKFTLKYKFSYDGEQFYTNLRFIKGSDNVFQAGDKIIFKTTEEKEVIFSVVESQLEKNASDYIPFETSAEELFNMQKGILDITFVRDGKRYSLEPINDKYADTKNNIKKITAAANELEYQRSLTKKSNNAAGELKTIAPKFYNRIYLGYSPTNDGCDFLNIGYTGGIRLAKSKNTPYLQFGAQFDWEVAPNDKSELSISLPIDISWRCYVGQSNVAISPFAGAIFRINPRHSTEDGMLLQPGFEIGANLDYKRFYCGVLYHMEFFTREGLGHIRGIALRVGCNF
ncbi:MAG: hypothetical protein J5630_04305 [Bacteroidaceae bacterium]|nr:hypothetical protein [Bacteroidaceae bacterium]